MFTESLFLKCLKSVLFVAVATIFPEPLQNASIIIHTYPYIFWPPPSSF